MPDGYHCHAQRKLVAGTNRHQSASYLRRIPAPGGTYHLNPAILTHYPTLRPGAGRAYVVRVGDKDAVVAWFASDPERLLLMISHNPLVLLDEPDRGRRQDDLFIREEDGAVDVPEIGIPVFDVVGDKIVREYLPVVHWRGLHELGQ